MSVERGTARQGTFPPLLRKFWIWFVFLTALSLTYTLVMTFVLKVAYPYGAPVVHYYEPFWDFTVFAQRFAHFREPSFWQPFNFPLTYPAPLGVVFAFFFRLPHPLWCYLALLALALAVGGLAFARGLIRRGSPRLPAFLFSYTLVALAWPIWYLLNRANIEGVVAIVLGLGVLCVLRDKGWMGATLIGIATAMKIFPFVLLALLLSKRKYREFAWGLIVAAFTTVGSLAVLGPSVGEANLQIIGGLAYFEREWTAKLMKMEVGFDHSLFGVLKVFIVGYNQKSHLRHPVWMGGLPLGTIVQLQHALTLYLLCAALFGIALYFFWMRKLPMLNQVIALTVCAVLLPPVSFDYTLTQLLVPFALLCLYIAELWRRGESAKGLKLCLGCFLVIFTAEAYLTFVVRWAGQFRAAALVLMLFVLMRNRFPWQELDAGSLKMIEVPDTGRAAHPRP